MKRITASDARKNWFSLLDEAVAGSVIEINRNGTKLVLRADKRSKAKTPAKKLISGEDLENADQWGWDWDNFGKLTPVTRK